MTTYERMLSQPPTKKLRFITNKKLNLARPWPEVEQAYNLDPRRAAEVRKEEDMAKRRQVSIKRSKERTDRQTAKIQILKIIEE